MRINFSEEIHASRIRTSRSHLGNFPSTYKHHNARFRYKYYRYLPASAQNYP